MNSRAGRLPVPARRLRIAHIIPADGIGGVEVAARSMLTRPLNECNFRIFWLRPTHKDKSALSPVLQFKAVREILRFDPDVAICSLWRSVPVALACKLLRPRIKLVQFLHAECPTHWLDRALTYIGMWGADAIWADSKRTLQRRALRKKRSQRVISFVTERLPPKALRSPTTLRLVSWGRLARQKGIDRAIEFVDILRSRGVNVRYEIWGPDGGEQAVLAEQVAAHGLQNYVQFNGPLDRSQLSQVAADATFFLQLSRFEGMGMAVVEAMQLGLIPIVTPVGEIGSYVQHDRSGLVIDPLQLALGADALQAILNDADRLATVRRNAIDHWHAYPLYADDVCAAAHALNGETV